MSFCLVFFFFRGEVEGLFWALYMVPIYTDTHGFQIGDVCGGHLGAGSAPGTLFLEDPFPAEGPGAWAGDSPPVAGKTYNPSLGTAPIWRKLWKGVLIPGPLPPHPLPTVWGGGEVADRFPGQHRGRLRWSSG